MIAVLAILSACSSTSPLLNDKVYGSSSKEKKLNLIPFSRDVVEAFPEMFTKIQVYEGPVGNDIVLYRYISVQKEEIIDGIIQIIDSTLLDEITIKSGQLGEIISSNPEKDRFRVSFREGDDEHYLTFGYAPGDNKNCVLFFKKEMDENGKETSYVNYGGVKYWVKKGGYLFCNTEQLTFFKENNFLEKGRKVKK